ncbi:MAG: O-antigen ligase family protein [Flavobacteriales bacterium]
MHEQRKGIAEGPDAAGAHAPRDAFRWAFLIGLSIIAIGMPWGEFLMSIGHIIVLIAWLWEGVAGGSLRARSRRAFTDPAVLVFLSFPLLHLVGLLWTEDLQWGLDLCRILLPVIVLPPVLASSAPLSRPELRILLLLFAWSVLVSTGACFALAENLLDYRALSHFISHIRLALMLCMAVFVFSYYWPSRGAFRLLHFLAIAWCLVFINLLGSIAGSLIVLGVAAWALWHWSIHRKRGKRMAVRSMLLLVPVVAIMVIAVPVSDALRVDPIERAPLPVRSAGGEVYTHDTTDMQLENGRYVWRNIAWAEVDREWRRISRVPLDRHDDHGNVLYGTLFRYMTSKGLMKDSAGLAALTSQDLQRIEQGVPTVYSGLRNRLSERVHEFVFELQRYRNTGDPSGYSVAMRLEFWKAARGIAAEHWLMGVGTGDTQRAFDAEYVHMRSLLSAKWRLRAHNQYLTWLVSFGVPGFLWCLFAWLYPAFRRRASLHPLFTAWAIAFIVSCFTEDTLETQAGITFAAFFYCVFVFGAAPSLRNNLDVAVAERLAA